MAQESPAPVVTPKLFDQILGAGSNLVGIELPNVEEAIAQFRQLAIRSGQSVYLWHPDTGIAALRESEMRVPGSRRLVDALRFIQQSIHFGIYLLTDFEEQIKPPNTALLRRMAHNQSGNERKLVFLAPKLDLPEGVADLVEWIGHHGDAFVRPRLRDGRWVV